MGKGLSPLISVTVLIVIALTIASFMATWMYDLTTKTTNETGSSAERMVMCRSAGLDFDSSYETDGVSYNLSGNGTAGTMDGLVAKVRNTGSVDLYGFSFEVEYTEGSTGQIAHYDATAPSQKTPLNPLRSGRSAMIYANVSPDLNESTVTITLVRVLNAVCPDLSPEVDV
jgi:hypothetical protein